MNEIREAIDPFFMYGTAWKEDNTEKLTLLALENGFRAIDTANQRKHYHEKGVGDAIHKYIEKNSIERSDLFIQTKFTYHEGQDHRLPYDKSASNEKQVRQSFQSSLDHLNIDYIDSYVLHGPSTHKGLETRDFEVWETMEDLLHEGLTKSIGVSNINPLQLQLLLDNANTLPTFVQNRCFAHHGWDSATRQICDENDIIYQGFSLLTANRNYLAHPKIKHITEKYERPIASIIFTFAKQIGILPLTGTTKEKHMKLDLNALNYELTSEEMENIEKIAIK